ncbi:MAG: hypothetical protein N3D20_02800 [Candidatus Pacearchaeota archaeon]|nr:hypothetical protein [Candidatus Pacearchaeota archaeon]
MGEEKLNQQINQPENQVENEIKQEQQEKQEDTSLVKHLRKQLEEKIQKEKELEKKLNELSELSRVANLDEIVNKLKKVDILEFENQVVKKFPELSGEIDEILKERKENEGVEDAVARYLGKKQMQASSLGSQRIAPNLQEPNIENLPLEEKERIAREAFKKIYGIE